MVRYRIGTTMHTGWLDRALGRLIPLPDDLMIAPGRTVLTATHLLWLDGTRVAVVSRQDLTAEERLGLTVTPRLVPVPGYERVLGLVGRTLLVAKYDATLGGKPYDHLPVWRVDAVTLDGARVRTLLTASSGVALPTPAGGLLVTGGPATTRWGVNLIAAAGAGVTIRKVAASSYWDRCRRSAGSP